METKKIPFKSVVTLIAAMDEVCRVDHLDVQSPEVAKMFQTFLEGCGWTLTEFNHVMTFTVMQTALTKHQETWTAKAPVQLN